MVIRMRAHRITGVLAAGLLVLAGCGGGDGEAPAEAQVQTPKPAPATARIAGRVADGYLSNARVCLDLESDGNCDGDDPITYSGSKGGYLFEVPESAAANASLRVQAIQHLTVDLDTGRTVTADYELAGPPGAFAFISPLTTLVALEMERTGESRAAVIADLQALIGTRADLLADFIEPDSTALTSGDADDYQLLHQLARVLVALVNQAGQQSNAYALQQAGFDGREAHREIWLQLREKLSTVSQALEDAGATRSTFKLETALSSLDVSISGHAVYLSARRGVREALASGETGDFFAQEQRVDSLMMYVPVDAGDTEISGTAWTMSLEMQHVGDGFVRFQENAHILDSSGQWQQALWGAIDTMVETATTAGPTPLRGDGSNTGVADTVVGSSGMIGSGVALGYETRAADLSSRKIVDIVNGLSRFDAVLWRADGEAYFPAGSRLYHHREFLLEDSFVYAWDVTPLQSLEEDPPAGLADLFVSTEPPEPETKPEAEGEDDETGGTETPKVPEPTEGPDAPEEPGVDNEDSSPEVDVFPHDRPAFAIGSELSGPWPKLATLAGELEDGQGLVLIWEYDSRTGTYGTKPARLGKWTYGASVRPHLKLDLPLRHYMPGHFGRPMRLNGETVLTQVEGGVGVAQLIRAGSPIWQASTSELYFNSTALDAITDALVKPVVGDRP